MHSFSNFIKSTSFHKQREGETKCTAKPNGFFLKSGKLHLRCLNKKYIQRAEVRANANVVMQNYFVLMHKICCHRMILLVKLSEKQYFKSWSCIHEMKIQLHEKNKQETENILISILLCNVISTISCINHQMQ